MTEMNGTIYFKSNENEGSTFTFSIPTIKCDPPVENAIAKDSSLEASNALVMNLDDDMMNICVLEGYAAKSGVKYKSFRRANEALDEDVADYSLAFIDLHMPEMDGYEFVRRLRMRNDKVVAIALSGDDMSSVSQSCVEAGFDYVLEKPLKYDDYIECINKMLLRVRHSTNI